MKLTTTTQVSVDGVMQANGGRDEKLDPGMERGGWARPLFDSGIRSGADVVKALALGADAVLLGRPYLWGLALDGAAGVETVLRMLLAELDLSLALCGYSRPTEVSRDALAPSPGAA